MREYIRANWKIVLAFTLLIICTVGLAATNDSQAQKDAKTSSSLQIVYCEMQQNIYDYTGEAIEPKVIRIVAESEDGERIAGFAEDLTIVGYSNNIEVGYADIEVSMKGYSKTLTVADAFFIQPAQTKKPVITESTKEYIDLTWEKTIGADGYLIYKSIDGGQTFMPVKDALGVDALTYRDTDVQLNQTYVYYIKTYVFFDNKTIFANASEFVKQYTPLSTPILESAKSTAYNSVTIQWKSVAGAADYQIYRSLSSNGEYICIGEVSGNASSFTDNTCECGKEYFYYIKAGQAVDDGQKIYGDSSEIKSAKTKPNRVGLTGKTSDYTKVTLNWKQSQGAHGYEIYKSIGNSSNYKLVKKIEQPDILMWSESNLDKEEAYYYKIRPYCVVDGTTVMGSNSGVYEKDIYVNFDYSSNTDGDVSVLTQYVGKQYVYGGTRYNAWDCSGFTKWAYNKHYGISLGRTAAEQASGGKSVSKNNRSAWQPGDLLFYKEGGRISHVAIYLGNGQMIHALNSKYDTLIQDVDYYEKWDKKTSLSSVRRYF